MHTDSPLAVIADASRLGGQLLKKILDPVIESQLCNSDAALMAALRNAPPVFMLSHDWPDLVGTIERIRLQAPRARLILLVSADNPNTRAIAKATCAAVLGSAVTIVQ